ncbi:MAG: tetratricopeptide repeat protein [Pseudolabrys sp.]
MIQQAITLHQQGQLDGAERLYTQILEIHHGHFDALHLLGVLMHQRSRPKEALDLIAKALAINPQSADAHANQARVLAGLGRYEAALTSYEHALALQPDDTAVLCDRPKILYALARYEEALAAYQELLAIQPNDIEALNDCGVLLHRMERYDEAVTSYDRALALHPDNAILLTNRANAQLKMKRLEDAVEYYSRALALQPDYADALNNRGSALTELERFDEAIASYDLAITVRPDYVEAFCNRGNVLFELSRFEEALASYKTALSLRPNDAELFNSLGRTLVELKRFNEALANYDRAISLRPNYPEVHYNRGFAQQELNSHGVALQAVRIGEQVPSNYIGFYINLDRSPARRLEIEDDIARHGLRYFYQRFPAADGNVLGVPAGQLTSGEIGCFTSHYLLLKQNAGSQKHLHVVEDDAAFSPYTARTIRSIIASGAIDQFDMLFTDTFVSPQRPDYQKYKALYDDSLERDAAGGVACIHPTIIRYSAGAVSYVVNFRSIPRLLEVLGRELMKGPVEALDLTIRRAAGEGAIRVGCLFPFVTTLHIEQNANSTIGGGRNDPLTWLALCLARHSFFIGCDHQALNSRVVETLPLGEQCLNRQSASDADAHHDLLNHILAFSRTEKYRRY